MPVPSAEGPAPPDEGAGSVSQSSDQPSSGCGWKGCAFSCMGIAVIGSAVLVALFFAGRSYLDQQLPVWKERYPELELALNSLEHLQTLRKHASELQEMAAMMDGMEDVDVSAVPDDIPMFDDPVDEQVQRMDGAFFVYQRLRLSSKDAACRLEQDFEARGWALHSDSAGSSQTWARNGSTCEVEITDVQGESELQMRCQLSNG